MKFGFLSAILFDYSFEKVINFTSDSGFNCAELMCWSEDNKSERCYAEVIYINVNKLNEKKSMRLIAI